MDDNALDMRISYKILSELRISPVVNNVESNEPVGVLLQYAVQSNDLIVASETANITDICADQSMMAREFGRDTDTLMDAVITYDMRKGEVSIEAKMLVPS